MKAMKYIVVCALVLGLSATGLYAQAPQKQIVKDSPYPAIIAEKDVPQYLQDISVTIRAGRSQGSGVFKVTKDGQIWVLTCGHVVRHLRTVRTPDAGKTLVEFSDAQIIRVLTEGGRAVGEMNFNAEVIRYSDADHGEDLALLRLRSKEYRPKSSAVFYLEKDIPAIGTRLLHCGSLLGQLGSNSVTNGIVSQHGRVFFNDVVFDQTNCATFPGSSGGIICLEKDGRYVGMLVRGAGETFSIYVPIRRLENWANKVGVGFILDDSKQIPTDAELRKSPIDDSATGPAAPASKDGNRPSSSSYSDNSINRLMNQIFRNNPLMTKELILDK